MSNSWRVVHKSERTLSGMRIDQAHEKNNAMRWKSGWISGTRVFPLIWMVAGPEVCRLAAQHETLSGSKEKVQAKQSITNGELSWPWCVGKVHCDSLRPIQFWIMWIQLDSLYSLRRIDLMIKYPQSGLPCFKMCFLLHTRPDTYEVRR